jgi:hypothetical protein
MMVDAPCSRVGHIYRKFAPFPNPGVGDFVGRVSTPLMLLIYFHSAQHCMFFLYMKILAAAKTESF